MLMVECAPRSGLALLFDGIIGQVEYDSMSTAHDSSHFPRNWDVGQEGELMSEHWLFVDKIGAHLGVNPDTISKGVTRNGMPAHKVGRLWKFPAREVGILEHRCESMATTMQNFFTTL